MAEGTGFFAAIGRFFRFLFMKKSRRISERADQMFTGSAEGIADAFDIQQDEMIEQFKELRDAISQVELVIAEKQQRLEDLNEEETGLIQRRDGALNMVEGAEEGSDDYVKHTAAFERFQSRIDEIEGQQEQIETEVTELSESMKRHMRRLTEMQAEIQKLPQEKAEQIAQFVSNQKIIELNDRLSGMQTSLDRGPLDAVRKANRELSAKAKISEKLAGTDVVEQDAQYEAAGRGDSAKSKMQQMLEGRKAARGEIPPAEEAPAIEAPAEEETESDEPEKRNLGV